VVAQAAAIPSFLPLAAASAQLALLPRGALYALGVIALAFAVLVAAMAGVRGVGQFAGALLLLFLSAQLGFGVAFVRFVRGEAGAGNRVG
jgi:hypothetical protein